MSARVPPSAEEAEVIDRGIPPVNRVRSMQSRVTGVLAIGVVVLLGGGFLTWYYAGHLPGERATATPKKRAERDDSKLPPLEPVRPSVSAVPMAPEPAPPTAVERLLGPAPELPADEDEPEEGSPDDYAPAREPEECVNPKSATPARDRSGPAYLSLNEKSVAAERFESAEVQERGDKDVSASLSRSLISEPVPTVRAQRLPDLRFLLSRGTSIDCTLETAIDTSLPSLTTCIAATDTYSADGTVVLVERGATLFGETRPAQTLSGRRVFVVWTEVRSGGVTARVDSPAADAQGRGGLSGTVDRHFWSRFGAAFLVSLIDGGIDAATRSRDRNAAVVVNPQDNQALLTEVLRSTADLTPTLGVAPGSRVKVLIARDVDFSGVYELRHVTP